MTFYRRGSGIAHFVILKFTLFFYPKYCNAGPEVRHPIFTAIYDRRYFKTTHFDKPCFLLHFIVFKLRVETKILKIELRRSNFIC
jgi:hypothetical protein